MNGLTKEQRKLLAHLKTYPTDISPSYEEIKTKMGYRSKSTVYRLMHALKERGAIDFIPGKKRTFKILTGKRMSYIDRQKKTIADCIAILETRKDCKTAVGILRTLHTTISLESEVHG